MYGDDDVPGGGIITGVGRVCRRKVVVVCNDATVKGGTYFPITVRARPAGLAAPSALPTGNRGFVWAWRGLSGRSRRVSARAGEEAPARPGDRAAEQAALAQGRHCHSTLPLTDIGCHCLGMCTVIWLSLAVSFGRNDGVTLG
jgi:hypothetical protein